MYCCGNVVCVCVVPVIIIILLHYQVFVNQHARSSLSYYTTFSHTLIPGVCEPVSLWLSKQLDYLAGTSQWKVSQVVFTASPSAVSIPISYN